MSASLWSAYRRTRVAFVESDGARWAIVPTDGPERGWAPPDAVPRFLAGVEVAWVLTAHNPLSDPLPADLNDARHRALADAVAAAGFASAPAVGQALDGHWSEESLIVPDAPDAAILDLARRFGQNAVYRWTPQEWSIIGVHLPGSRHYGWRGFRVD